MSEPTAEGHPERARRLGVWVGLMAVMVVFGALVRGWFLARDGITQPIPFHPVFVWCVLLGLFRDALLSAALTLPALVGVLWVGAGRGVWRGLVGVSVALQCVAGVVLLLDEEFMRYFLVHMHFGAWSYAGEAGRLSGSVGDLIKPYEMFVSWLGLPAFLLVGQLWAARRAPALRLPRPGWRLAAVGVGVSLAVVVGLYNYKMTRWFTREVLAYHVSENGVFYMLGTLRDGKHLGPPLPSEARYLEARQTMRAFMQPHKLQSDSSQPWLWLSDEEAPLARGTPHHACALGLAGGLGVDCAKDGDGDGAALSVDCDDTRADTHPGASDAPGDGLDQDCDGVDSARPNVILVLLEGVRGANVGALAPWGGTLPELVTPELDKLAAEGLLLHNFYAPGITTARGLLPALTGTWPHQGSMLLREYGYLNFRPLPEVLRGVGYRAAYFHAGDVRFDNKRRWFDRWFDEVHDMTNTFASAPRVSTWGVSDEVMYDGILDWADQQRGPFFVALMPVNNHHPWVIPDDPTFTKPQPNPQSVYHKYLNTVAWSDHTMGAFVRAARAKPWGANTWFIITSDHGQAMGEHGVTNDMGGVPPYQISMRIPFVLVGPALPSDPQARAQLEAQVGSLVDIPTTVTDLLGVQAPHPWAGRSLLAPPPYEDGYAILSNPYRDNWVGLRQGDLKSIHGRASGATWVFDLAQDPDERKDRAADFQERVRRDVALLDAHVDLQEYMIIYNKLWSPKLGR